MVILHYLPFLLLSLLAPAAAEEAPSTSGTEQVRVSLVLIDVVVRDRKENPVTGLTREDFELMVDPYGSTTVGDPDEMLDKFVTGQPENWGRMSDPVVDDLFSMQSKEMNEAKRIQLVKQMAKRVLEKAWRIQGLWTTRLEVRTARLRNYEPMPSHWNNRRFEDVWLTAK